MSLLIGFLGVVLALTCIFIVLLVLIQLPKKEAGMGQAFGGGATDALFGAGSGNVLTKLTKYAAIAFFTLALLITILQNHSNEARARARQLEKGLSERAGKSALPSAPAAAPATSNAPAAAPANSVNRLLSNSAPALTVPAAPATPAPAV